MTLELAIDDLANVLENSQFLDRVDTIKIKPGSRDFSLVIGVGSLLTESQFGKNKYNQAISLDLTIKQRITPQQLSEILKEIDNEIIADRRRNSQAQTTVLDEDGWTPVEAEKESFTAVSRFVEVHVYENQV
jgi:hypothetical protein